MSARRGRWLPVIGLLVLAPSDAAWGGHPPTSTPPSLCLISYPSDARITWECRTLRGTDTLERLFGDRWKDVARFNRIDRRHAHPGISIKAPKRLDDVAGFTPMPPEYPPARGEAKFILANLREQFLGAYEHGRLVFSAPIATGEAGHETPTGEFRINAVHRRHASSLYTIEGTDTPYPMNDALRFYTDRDGVEFWIHGRDMPGYPASHGCIGLYDEAMQRSVYGFPRDPALDDARRFLEWVVAPREDGGRLLAIRDGPRMLVIDHVQIQPIAARP